MHFPDTTELMRWDIGDSGFDMISQDECPRPSSRAFAPTARRSWRGQTRERSRSGRFIPAAGPWSTRGRARFRHSSGCAIGPRGVLRDFGNMSSATVMFVLDKLLASGEREAPVAAWRSGPGLIAETMLFRTGRAA